MSPGHGALAAVRRSVAFQVCGHVALASVHGAGAHAILDRVLPCDLGLYDAQARPTVLLDEDGTVIADVIVAKRDGRFLLFVDGLPHEKLAAVVAAATEPGDVVSIDDLSAESTIVSVHGPFAWELLGLCLGQALVAMPPLTLLELGGVTILRAGRTGEFGYELLVPRDRLASFLERLESLGRGFDLGRASLADLDRCALEIGAFVIRTPGVRGLSPAELQLQWRLSSRKPFPARDATTERRRRATHRVAWLGSSEDVAADSELWLDGASVGRVLICTAPSVGGGFVGLGLLESGVAHPGLAFVSGAATVVARSPPLVQPWSARVRLHADRYATRDPGRFPP